MTTLQSRPQQRCPRADAQAPERPVGYSTGWWGMMLFIASEAALFGCFLASYFYLRFSSGGPWPPAGEKVPDLLYPSIGTGILVVSCVPMAVSVRASMGGRFGRVGIGLSLTWLAGAAFIAMQALDYLGEWPDSTLSKDAYGSLFYTITGLHAVHVVVGIIMVSMLLAGTALRRLVGKRAEAVGLVALYWYLLAALAVAIYFVVYISPYL